MRTFILRALVVLVVIAGVNYLVWRWAFSLNWGAWWLSVPLVLAETYSLIDVALYGLTVWRSKRREPPPAAYGDETVDVFVTTYNEPLDMVLHTTTAALAITHPHQTWVLDDGNRDELRTRVEALGAGYIARGANWDDRPRHAKAGNLNNALMQTTGEFVLILDADQVPGPQILSNTLGYFRRRKVAVVQTPQYFGNVPEGDPLGSQAPLFYGLIQEGKDGWDAAYFCGSNAILRREAVMNLGLRRYVVELKSAVRTALRRADRIIRVARRAAARDNPVVVASLAELQTEIAAAAKRLRDGAPVADVTYRVQRIARTLSQRLVDADFAALNADLAVIRELSAGAGNPEAAAVTLPTVRPARLDAALSPLSAIETVAALLESIDVHRGDEAQPVMPMSTISVTEDLATAMRLHALGWHSVYHHEILAVGEAPVDLRTMLGQRLRWAQGTMQLFFSENPLFIRGLSLGQRLMYFATMWSYLIGFAAIIFLAAPVIFLTVGILPVNAIAWEFAYHFVPYIVLSQALFLYSARGVPTWRGQQYSLALFPTWMLATLSAAANVYFGRRLSFMVTPKNQTIAKREWRLVAPQLIAMAILVLATVVGVVRLMFLGAEPIGTSINILWVCYDIAMLAVVFRAVRIGGELEREKR